jgi:IclR family KDG regulon transcriptional repressor
MGLGVSEDQRPAIAAKAALPEGGARTRRRRRVPPNGEMPSGTVQSVVAAAAILDTLAAAPGAMRLTEIARALGEAKARIHRHLTTLRHLGLVDQERSSECYRLGWKLLHLGQAAADQFDLRRLAEPFMARLRDLSHQTVVLSVPAHGEAMVASVMESSNFVTISVRQGARLPAHASAQGRIVLAFASPEMQRQVLSRKLAALTPRTVTAPAALRQRLAAIRENLYELAPGETLLGITTLASPLLDAEGALVGTIAIVGTDQYIPCPVDETQLQLVRACAAALSRRLDSTAYDRLELPMAPAFVTP